MVSGLGIVITISDSGLRLSFSCWLLESSGEGNVCRREKHQTAPVGCFSRFRCVLQVFGASTVGAWVQNRSRVQAVSF